MRILLLLIFSSSFILFSQDEQRFFFGFNVGTKLGNKNYAARYSGGYNDELYQHLIQPQVYNEIYILLGDKNFQVPFDSYPSNLRYIPQLLTGLSIGYKLSPTFQTSLAIDVSKLKIKDVYTLEVLDPSNTTSQEQYVLGNLYGEESRFNGRFNMDYVSENDKFNFIIGGSAVFSAWRMEEHFAEFRNYIIPLYSKFNVTNNITNKVSDIGWGLGINLGFEYKLNDKITCQFMYQPYTAKLDYGYNINKRILLEHDIVVRILWK